MQDYRLYFLDLASHIKAAVPLACEDDADAIRQVAAKADGRAMELWRRDRLVRAFPREEEAR